MHRLHPNRSRSHTALAAKIRKLPAGPRSRDPRYPTEKEHWLEWLGEYGGPGAYGRKGYDRDAKFAYNHIMNSQMLLYLAWAAGVPDKQVKAAASACEGADEVPARQVGAVRRIIPWADVEKALWP